MPVLNISFSLKSSFSNDCLPVAEINSMTMIFFVKKSIHGHFFLCFWLFNVIFLPMTGFEQRTPGVGSDRSTNWATTTVHFFEHYHSIYIDKVGTVILLTISWCRSIVPGSNTTWHIRKPSKSSWACTPASSCLASKTATGRSGSGPLETRRPKIFPDVNIWNVAHSRPLFIYIRLFNSVDSNQSNKCSI